MPFFLCAQAPGLKTTIHAVSLGKPEIHKQLRHILASPHFSPAFCCGGPIRRSAEGGEVAHTHMPRLRQCRRLIRIDITHIHNLRLPGADQLFGLCH